MTELSGSQSGAQGQEKGPRVKKKKKVHTYENKEIFDFNIIPHYL